VRQSLQALMPAFEFASLVPFGQQQGGLLLRAAAAASPPAALLAALETALGLATTAPGLLRYADLGRGVQRCLRLAGPPEQRTLQAFVLAGPAGRAGLDDWAWAQLQQAQPVQATARELLAPGGRLQAGPGRQQVCNCLDVDEDQIRQQLTACAGTPAARLASLQSALKCGTQCGSCLPALRRWVEAVPAPV
jgi:assimilatory nitrate reductase catalytic subunit